MFTSCSHAFARPQCNYKVSGDASLEIYADPETLKQRIKTAEIHVVEEVPQTVNITL